MLFDKKKRTRTAPKKPGENEYQFYDSSTRPEFQVYRDLVNGWIAELPESERAETINRFRKSDTLGYQAVLAELAVHAALRRQGYVVEVHASCGHPSHKPDFLARDANGNPIAFVEVTSFGPAQEDVARSNREAAIYNAIDKVKLPAGWRLGYDVVKRGSDSPNLKKLRRSIEAWAATAVEGDPHPPELVFDAGDWKIELTLIGGFKPDAVPERVIARAMGDIRVITPARAVREAVEKKGTRYGDMDIPFIVVVADFNGELVGGDHNDEALIDALFGSVVTRATGLGTPEEEITEERINDGYLGRPENPRHRGVSGVILLPKPHLWDLRNERWQPKLMKNPWANIPVPDELLPLPGYKLNDENEFEPTTGRTFADILGLPEVWPPEKEPNYWTAICSYASGIWNRVWSLFK